MVFSSYVFLFVFLPLALAFYYAVPRKGKAYVLIVASCIFYGWWRPDFVVLMFVSAIVDFVAGQLISKDQRRGKTGKVWLVSALTIQLGLLGYFKYANFAVASINSVLSWTDHAPIPWVEVILPIGISFYTFKTMSYTIDVYFGRVARIDSFVNFLCYVTLFPEPENPLMMTRRIGLRALRLSRIEASRPRARDDRCAFPCDASPGGSACRTVHRWPHTGRFPWRRHRVFRR